MTVRNSLGGTLDDPCGPWSTELGLISGCSSEYVKSWLEAGDLLSIQLQSTQAQLEADPVERQNVINWLVRWKSLSARLRNRSVFNPFGMNWAGGTALLLSDTDARNAAALVADGAALLVANGGVLPPSIDPETAPDIAKLDALDWFGFGLTAGALAVGGYALYQWWKP